MVKFVSAFALGYSVLLTAYSVLRFHSNTLHNRLLNSVFGLAIIGIVYFYLNWSLNKLNSDLKASKGTIILIGTLITFIGCLLSTTIMWFYNDSIGLLNNISNSIRAVIINGLLGLIISIIITNRLEKNQNFSK
jgi:hypothetical protein